MRALGFTFLQRLVAQDSTFKPNLYSGAIVGTQAQRDLVPSSTADHETQTLWRSILWVVDTPIANGKYEVFEYTGTWVKRFECTLLEISEGVSSAVTQIFSAVSQARGNGSPITNNVPPVDGMLYIDNLTRNLWCYAQGSWAPAHSLGDIVSIPDYRTPDNYPAGAVVRGDTDLGFTIDGIYRKDQPSTGTLWIRVGGAYPSPESIPAIQFGHIYAPGIPFYTVDPTITGVFMVTGTAPHSFGSLVDLIASLAAGDATTYSEEFVSGKLYSYGDKVWSPTSHTPYAGGPQTVYTCQSQTGPVAQTVFDPFAGSYWTLLADVGGGSGSGGTAGNSVVFTNFQIPLTAGSSAAVMDSALASDPVGTTIWSLHTNSYGFVGGIVASTPGGAIVETVYVPVVPPAPTPELPPDPTVTGNYFLRLAYDSTTQTAVKSWEDEATQWVPTQWP